MESFGHWQILLKILLRSKQDSSERNQLLLFSAAAASSMRAFLLGFSTFCDGGKEKKLVPAQLQSNGVMLVRSVGKNVKYCHSSTSHSRRRPPQKSSTVLFSPTTSLPVRSQSGAPPPLWQHTGEVVCVIVQHLFRWGVGHVCMSFVYLLSYYCSIIITPTTLHHPG